MGVDLAGRIGLMSQVCATSLRWTLGVRHELRLNGHTIFFGYEIRAHYPATSKVKVADFQRYLPEDETGRAGLHARESP